MSAGLVASEGFELAGSILKEPTSGTTFANSDAETASHWILVEYLATAPPTTVAAQKDGLCVSHQSF